MNRGNYMNIKHFCVSKTTAAVILLCISILALITLYTYISKVNKSSSTKASGTCYEKTCLKGDETYPVGTVIENLKCSCVGTQSVPQWIVSN